MFKANGWPPGRVSAMAVVYNTTVQGGIVWSKRS